MKSNDSNTSDKRIYILLGVNGFLIVLLVAVVIGVFIWYNHKEQVWSQNYVLFEQLRHDLDSMDASTSEEDLDDARMIVARFESQAPQELSTLLKNVLSEKEEEIAQLQEQQKLELARQALQPLLNRIAGLPLDADERTVNAMQLELTEKLALTPDPVRIEIEEIFRNRKLVIEGHQAAIKRQEDQERLNELMRLISTLRVDSPRSLVWDVEEAVKNYQRDASEEFSQRAGQLFSAHQSYLENLMNDKEFQKLMATFKDISSKIELLNLESSAREVRTLEERISFFHNPDDPDAGNRLSMSLEKKKLELERLKLEEQRRQLEAHHQNEALVETNSDHDTGSYGTEKTATITPFMRDLLNAENINEINQLTAKHETPLYIAAREDNAMLVKVLLEAGADPNIPNDNGMTPLHIATRKKNDEIVPLLISGGATIDAVTTDGLTALHIAAYYGSVSTLKLLLKSSARYDILTEKKENPLHYAAFSGSMDKVKFLVDAGADIFGVTVQGYTTLDMAKTQEIREYLQKLGVKSGSRPKAQGNEYFYFNGFSCLSSLSLAGSVKFL